jgi:hypothetical protein
VHGDCVKWFEGTSVEHEICSCYYKKVPADLQSLSTFVPGPRITGDSCQYMECYSKKSEGTAIYNCSNNSTC